MQSYPRSWLACLLSSSLIVFLTACSTVSENFVQRPAVNIPKLPASVVYTEPQLPKEAAKDAEATAAVLKSFEAANEKNRFAIGQAHKHNDGLRRIYNIRARPKKAETSSWFPSWMPEQLGTWPKF